MSELATNLGVGKKEKETFAFEKDESGVSNRVSGEEVENGWIVTIEKRWKEKSTATGYEETKWNSWKYISKIDPRELLKKKPDDAPLEDENTEIKNLLSSVATDDGMLMVE